LHKRALRAYATILPYIFMTQERSQCSIAST
jgi:hypothetical protein